LHLGRSAIQRKIVGVSLEVFGAKLPAPHQVVAPADDPDDARAGGAHRLAQPDVGAVHDFVRVEENDQRLAGGDFLQSFGERPRELLVRVQKEGVQFRVEAGAQPRFERGAQLRRLLRSDPDAGVEK
jgi:hypothetical protein